jgi:Predicted membrane protein (DUF2207)
MGVFDASGRELEIVLLGLAAGALWLAAAAFVYVSRFPQRPAEGPRTLELGPEQPAVASFLVHDFRVTDEAVSATLLDLAARGIVEVEQRGPGAFYIRLRQVRDEPLTPYERRVLDHLERLASGGVVPAEALTTGPDVVSKEWRRAFGAEVVADAKARGLSRDAIGSGALLVLVGGAALPALAAIALEAYGVALLVGAVAYGIVNWIRVQHPQRETAEGLEAASRWLGVRAELAANRVFREYSPLTVPLWNRLLAYGAALGVASGASRPLFMGAESDTHVWSSHGGRWRPVRVRYPRLWPPGWGVDPRVALIAGLGSAVTGGLLLYSRGAPLAEAAGGGWDGLLSSLSLVGLCVAVVVGIAVAVMAVQDQWTSYELTGPILRLRAFGEDNDDKETRYYAAVDDGSSRTIRALRLNAGDYGRLRQGQLVTVATTPHLGRVRWIEALPESST